MLDFQKYNIKEKKQEKNKVTRIIKKKVYEVCFKNRVFVFFFRKVIVDYKN